MCKLLQSADQSHKLGGRNWLQGNTFDKFGYCLITSSYTGFLESTNIGMAMYEISIKNEDPKQVELIDEWKKYYKKYKLKMNAFFLVWISN